MNESNELFEHNQSYLYSILSKLSQLFSFFQVKYD